MFGIQKKYLLEWLLLVIAFNTAAQKTLISGSVKDLKTAELLPGVAVVVNKTGGVISDVAGNYRLTVDTGHVSLSFRMMGYREQVHTLYITAPDTVRLDVRMEPLLNVFNTVVVSAGRYEQKLENVTVSLDVLKPYLLEQKNTVTVDQAVEQVPGVNVADGQINIRGGSGYSYGAGSRVLLLVDDLPMLSADASDIKWSFLPVENLEQVEVMKGAASVLFGSSALNGVVQLRTAYPRDTPATKLTMFTGIYGKPRRKELAWWGDAVPVNSGFNFCHSRKINSFDLVVAGNLFHDEGYRQLESRQRYRFNFNTRYHFSKIKGLSLGLNGNYMQDKGGLFLLWQDADSGAYRPAGGSIQRFTNPRASLDPSLVYFDNGGGKHSLRTRYFHTDNVNDKKQSSRSDLYYAEYQYQKKTAGGIVYSAGATNVHGKVNAPDIYGNHSSRNLSLYGQLDKKWRKLSLSLGIRGEYFKIDTAQTKTSVTLGNKKTVLPFRPVFRTGLNYPLAEYTFLRASFGQGYRFPSIAEKYISTSVGGLKIFPNPGLQPETGWSAEAGIKQGVSIRDWKAFLDVAAFITEYKDMMEFTFGYYFPDSIKKPNLSTYLNSAGFKSVNVGNTRISGIEFSATGQGKMFGLNTTLLAGYTYTNPVNSGKRDTTASTEKNILKYRFYHSLRGDVQFDYGKWSLGFSARFNSYIINIDRKFEEPLFSEVLPAYPIYILPGLKEYRAKHNKGITTCDARLSYRLTRESRLALIVNNVFNVEYMDRPGSIRPPRMFMLQLSYRF